MLDPNGIFVREGAAVVERPIPLPEPAVGLVTNNGEVTTITSRFVPVVALGSVAWCEGRRSPIPGDSVENISVIARRDNGSDVLAVKLEAAEEIVVIDNALLSIKGEAIPTVEGDDVVATVDEP